MTAVPLRIRIASSRCLAGLLALVHALSWIVLYPLALPETLKLVLAAAIAASGVHSIVKTALLRSRHAIVALEVGSDGVAIREQGAEQWLACHVLATTFISSHLTVLNLEPVKAGKVRHVVVLPDNVSRDDFRRLRVWLRWNKSAAAQPALTRFFGQAATRPFGQAATRPSRRTAADTGEE